MSSSLTTTTAAAAAVGGGAAGVGAAGVGASGAGAATVSHLAVVVIVGVLFVVVAPRRISITVNTSANGIIRVLVILFRLGETGKRHVGRRGRCCYSSTVSAAAANGALFSLFLLLLGRR
jgi:hypothetical protein